MAMIKCPECNADVAESAFDCPKCGATLRKPTRTIFGKIVKWGFIVFNVIMVAWMGSYFGFIGESMEGAKSGAEGVGMAIGAGIGVTMLLVIWVFVDIILGMVFLFTRPSK